MSDDIQMPEIDYLSKDYASFRQVILNHLAARVPDWKEASEADVGNVIVEVLAYAADYLSYYQDALATEAYLGTARRRTSVKRHTRLLDYILHEGCNARAWVHFAVSQDTILPQGTPILTCIDELVGIPVISPDSPAYTDALSLEAVIFETMYNGQLLASQNELRFFVEAGQDTILPAGSIGAILHDTGDLKAGQVLLFEEVRDALTGEPFDADPAHRHIVHLSSVVHSKQGEVPVVTITWSSEDALPFPLTLATHCDGTYIAEICVARGNMLLADQGRTIYYEPLPPVTAERRYHPHLLFPELTHCVPESLPPMRSASQATLQDPLKALPAITLFKNNVIGSLSIDTDMLTNLNMNTLSPALRLALYRGKGIALSDEVEISPLLNEGWILHDPASKQRLLLNKTETLQLAVSVLKEWTLRRDLISTLPQTNTYCVDMEERGQAYLRFCTETTGLPPEIGSDFVATYRVGRGPIGNISADTLAHAIINNEYITAVRNPLAARGGIPPQPLEEARLQAPFELQTQQRCVTEADYASMAGRYPGVVKAIAHLHWTGSWHTMFIYVQRPPGLFLDEFFKGEMVRYLETFRSAGYEITLHEPYYVSLRITLRVCLQAGHYRSIVHNLLLQKFSSAPGGFFYPGNFTFGQPIYSSQLIATAMSIQGVAEVEVSELRRLDTQMNSLEPVPVHELEIIRLDNDSHLPQNGTIHFQIEGGL